MKMQKYRVLLATTMLINSSSTFASAAHAVIAVVKDGAMGALIGDAVGSRAVKLFEKILDPIANDYLENTCPFILTFGVPLKVIREYARTTDAKGLKDWLAEKRKAKSASNPKNLKSKIRRMLGHKGFEKCAVMSDPETGTPILDKDGHQVYIPFLCATSPLCKDSDVYKKMSPRLKTVSILAGACLGIRANRQAAEKAKVATLARDAKNAADKAALIRDTATAVVNALAAPGNDAVANIARTAATNLPSIRGIEKIVQTALSTIAAPVSSSSSSSTTSPVAAAAAAVASVTAGTPGTTAA